MTDLIKKKLLFVCPHLSTGGQPQYTYKQIKHFINEFEIEVVELNNSGGDAFVVQKNRIKSLVPIHTLDADKSKILELIKEFQPDIIHFQEIPEFDLDTKILDKIFVDDRNYFIIATTHGSYTKPDEIRYHPDKYVLVSKWSKQKFEEANLGIDLDIWEYPIEEYQFDKEAAQMQLGLDPTYKHVLNVGLFSPGKNQAEIFTIAKELEKYKIKFHFVGNQAGNFEHYWKPIMKYKPDNCIVWGERDDVDTFYSACDMFYFSSKLELNPLSIKEALSYKLPSLFRKLHTYLDTYDDNPLVTYIDDDLHLTKKIILEKLKYTIYDNLIKNENNKIHIKNKVYIDFNKGPFVEIKGQDDLEYVVEFIDKKTDKILFKSTIKNNCWCKCNIEYFIDWKIIIYENGVYWKEYSYQPESKNIRISLHSSSLGDTLAWIPYAEEFRKKHNCKLFVSTFMNDLFFNEYLDIQFVKPSDNVDELYATYSIGLFYNDDNSVNFYKNPIDPKTQTMQKMCSDILGLDYREIKPKLKKRNPIIDSNYKQVTIGIYGTAQAKFWNNLTGWQDVVYWLNNKGYVVKLLSKEGDNYMGNKLPNGIIKHPNGPLELVMDEILKSKAFIGIGSGLSWLSWALDVPTVLISGFSYEWAEMKDCIRISAPQGKCEGCFNRIRLNPNDWNWCPDHKGTERQFECSKYITSEMVITELEKFL